MRLKNLSLTKVQTLAQKLAVKYTKKPAIIGLSGQLGAGKTTFVKAFAKALGVRYVKSPSFVIVHEYHSRNRKIYHLDFYRLNRYRQLAPLGLEEILNHGQIVLIEWVDKFPALMKKCDLLIRFQINKNLTRNVNIRIRKT